MDVATWWPGRFGPSTTGDAPFNIGNEGAYFANSQVSVSQGCLVLTLTPSVRTLNGRTYTYASGTISSEPSYHFSPGCYVEARIRANSGDGCWPAFWAVPSGQWPPEFDIVEYFNTAAQGRPHFNFRNATGQTGPTVYGESGMSYLNEFHNYGMHWDGICATPYLDGKPYRTVAARVSIPEFIIFNLSMYAGRNPPDGTTMQVDWIRVWR